MNRYYSKDGETWADVEGGDGRKTLFCVHYDKYSYQYEEHEIKYYEWAKRPHGNAPGGTPYGYFRATLNGKRIVLTV